MILIVGGAYQGKAAFAESLFPKIRWMDGETCDFADLYECQGILRFHAYIRRMLEKGQDVDDLAEKLMRRNPGAVVITDEIGYGIVPADAFCGSTGRQPGEYARSWPRTQKRSGGYPVELERGSRMMKIYLIRHSITEGNRRKRYIGRTDEPLCRQA